MAIAGLSEVGRDKYGVFPLKGKVLNVREASIKQINSNAIFHATFLALSILMPKLSILKRFWHWKVIKNIRILNH